MTEGTIHIAYKDGVHYDAVIPHLSEGGASLGLAREVDDSALVDIGNVGERTSDIETKNRTR